MRKIIIGNEPTFILETLVHLLESPVVTHTTVMLAQVEVLTVRGSVLKVTKLVETYVKMT